jgi:transcriptional regulator with XRE-family HTH domain
VIMNQKQRTDIGKRIRTLREELNKTQIDMSKILKVQQSAISKLEKGDITPTVDVLLTLNRISGKSIDWILRGD